MNGQRLLILGAGSLCVGFIIPTFWPARVKGGPRAYSDVHGATRISAGAPANSAATDLEGSCAGGGAKVSNRICLAPIRMPERVPVRNATTTV